MNYTFHSLRCDYLDRQAQWVHVCLVFRYFHCIVFIIIIIITCQAGYIRAFIKNTVQLQLRRKGCIGQAGEEFVLHSIAEENANKKHHGKDVKGHLLEARSLQRNLMNLRADSQSFNWEFLTRNGFPMHSKTWLCRQEVTVPFLPWSLTLAVADVIVLFCRTQFLAFTRKKLIQKGYGAWCK